MKRKDLFLNRMVGSYTLVFSLILAVVLGIVYFILAANEQSRAQLNHQLLVAQPVKQVEKFVEEMDTIAYRAMADQALINRFANLREEADPGNFFTSNVMDDIDTASLLAGMNRGTRPVWRLSAYNNWGDFISTGTVVDRRMVPTTLMQRDVAAIMQYFRDEHAAGRGGYLLYAPGKDAWSNYYKSSYVSLLRPIMNVYSGDVVGVVEVQQNISVLAGYLQSPEEAALHYNVYDPTGTPVLLQGTQGDEVVATALIEPYNWQVELLEPVGVMQGTRARLVQLLVIAWASLTFILFLVIRLISQRISKPLTTLTREVRHIDIAAPQKIPEIDTRVDEIVALQNAFNQVMESLTFSMEQEKKTFLLAMQAQMNPHFLYNVLSVVNAVALQGRSETVVAICGNLSGMLRYSSSYETGTATIAEEMEHTREYLELMKARYQGMFHYTMFADPDLVDIQIPKLVIQPICENAFTHPFANMEPPYELDIRVEKEADGWCICVRDNGTGFDEEMRQKVMHRANSASYEDLSRLQIGGLGLVSTVLRLKLLTRRPVVCDIQNEQKAGARIVIHVQAEEPTA